MKKIVFAALAAIFGSTPAFADTETGLHPYVGVIVGLDHVILGSNGASGSKDGLVYGGTLGVDTTMSAHTILGIEGEVTGSTVSESAYNVLVLGDSAKLSAGRDLYIGARAGVYAAPNLLLYVKGGYTNARVTATYVSGGTTTTAGDNLGGYRVGTGLEYGVNRLHLRLEYRYSDYGKYKYNGFNTGLNAQRHQVVAGITYPF
jgi:outer membrane immunogenic protein